MKIRNGDNVVIISGKDKGKTGKVLRVLPTTSRIVVAGVNMRTRHVRATPQQPGQKIQYEASINVSNAMLVDPKTKKRTRIGFDTDKKGKKQRIAKKSGEALPNTKAGAAVASTKKDEAAKKEEPKKAVSAEAKETAKKKPFWKRGGDEKAADTDEVKESSHMEEDHSVPDQVERKSARSHQRGS